MMFQHATCKNNVSFNWWMGHMGFGEEYIVLDVLGKFQYLLLIFQNSLQKIEGGLFFIIYNIFVSPNQIWRNSYQL